MQLGSLTFFSWQTVFNVILFALAFWASCYLPGSIIVRTLRQKLSPLNTLVAASFLGLALFAWQAYLLAWANLRFLGWLYILFWLVLGARSSFWNKVHFSLQKATSWFQRDVLAVVLAVFGIASQMMFVAGSGWNTSSGIQFWFLNAFDGVMHLAFTQELMGHFPPQQPGAHGLALTHYHYWADLVGAEFARLWGISVPFLTFQALPFVLACLGSILLYKIVRALGGSRLAARWMLFFHYFAGNALWIFMLFMHRQFGAHLPAIDHGVIQFSNTPQAFAKFLFLAGFWWCLLAWKKQQSHLLFLAAIIFSSLFGFKVYFGIFAVLGWSLVLAGQWCVALWQGWKEKRKKVLPWISTAAYTLFGVLSLAVYIPANASAGGLFFVPLAWPKLVISAQYLDWTDWWLRRQVYELHSNLKWLIVLDILVIGVFLVGVFGTRLLGIWAIWEQRKKMIWQSWWFLAPTTLLFIFTGMNFLQTSGEYNVFNFFVVALLPMSLFLSLWLGQYQGKKWMMFLSFIIIILSVPRPLADFGDLILDTWQGQNIRRVAPSEREMHQWIRENVPPNVILQTHSMHEMDRETPWTPYFSQRSAYVAGTGILLSHNQPVKERSEYVRKALRVYAARSMTSELRSVGIEYLVLEKNGGQQLLNAYGDTVGMRLVYENERWQVWQLIVVSEGEPLCFANTRIPGEPTIFP